MALLRSQYNIYLVRDKPELANAIFDAMQSCGATWLGNELSQSYEAAKAIFLPHEQAQFMCVLHALREAGFVELGQHLEDVACSGMPEVLRRRLHSHDWAVSETGGEDEADHSAPRG